MYIETLNNSHEKRLTTLTHIVNQRNIKNLLKDSRFKIYHFFIAKILNFVLFFNDFTYV